MNVEDIASQISVIFGKQHMTEETKFLGFMFPQVVQRQQEEVG